MDYQKAYTILFGSITDAINILMQAKLVTPKLDACIIILQQAQCKTEDLYMAQDRDVKQTSCL